MTREEAIKRIDEQYKICEEFYYLSASPEKDYPGVMSYMEALAVAITALRPVSREQVRRGTIIETIKDGRANRVFSCCGHDFTELTCWFMPDFCPSCGAPMTDEAVQMVMERMEAISE